MRATINGVAVEGTPQEIVDYQKICDDLRRKNVYIKPPLGEVPAWIKSQIDQGWTSNFEVKKLCEGPCFCTGKCHK